MKKIYIISILLIVASIAILRTTKERMRPYSTFTEAAKVTEKVKVVGQLSKDKTMHYDPQTDPNYFSFYATDADGVERKVVLLAQKPQDFELSEQIVVTGKMNGDEFIASDMLMKCPSKYKDEEIYIKGAESGS